MATKKNKPTVTNTQPTSDTVEVTMGNSPTTNAVPLKATVAPLLPPDVIRVPVKLEDVQNQVGMFTDYPRGRYVMSYEDGSTVQVLSVFWDGEGTVSV